MLRSMGPTRVKLILGAAFAVAFVCMLMVGHLSYGDDKGHLISAHAPGAVSFAGTNPLQPPAPLAPDAPCECSALCNCPPRMVCHCSCTCERPGASPSSVPVGRQPTGHIDRQNPQGMIAGTSPSPSPGASRASTAFEISAPRDHDAVHHPTATKAVVVGSGPPAHLVDVEDADPTVTATPSFVVVLPARSNAPSTHGISVRRVRAKLTKSPTRSRTPSPTRARSPALTAMPTVPLPVTSTPTVPQKSVRQVHVRGAQTGGGRGSGSGSGSGNVPPVVTHPYKTTASPTPLPSKWFSPYYFSSEKGYAPANSTGTCDFSACAGPPYVYYVTAFRNRGGEYNRFLRTAARDIASVKSPVPTECVCAAVADFNSVVLGPTTEAALSDWPGPTSSVKVRGEFTRAGGLRLALDASVSTAPDESVIFFVDTDMVVFDGMLARLLAMTERGKSVYAPIVWSTKGTENDETDGWWRLGGAGMISLYLSDYRKAVSAWGGSHPGEERVEWGLEDQKLIESFRLVEGLELVRTCAPELWHLFHLKAPWKFSLSGSPQTLLRDMYRARKARQEAARAVGTPVKTKAAVPWSFQDDDTWAETEWRLALPPSDMALELWAKGLTADEVCTKKHRKPWG